MSDQVGPARPGAVAVVLGTGTEVGKTWCTARLLEQARARGTAVAARKPVQSFEPGDGPTDAEVLAAASGEGPEQVCPRHRWYPAALAPPMAADRLGSSPIRVEDLVAELAWPAGSALGVVETAGGVRSPVAHDADSVGLARRLAPDVVVLVADAGLGTINAVRLSLEAAAGLPVHVHLNRFDDGDDLHRRNRAWLERHDGTHASATLDELARAVLDLR